MASLVPRPPLAAFFAAVEKNQQGGPGYEAGTWLLYECSTENVRALFLLGFVGHLAIRRCNGVVRSERL